MELNLLIGGEAGQGLASFENTLVDILSKLRFRFFATKNYMSRVRGGHNYHMFRISENPVHALSGDGWDIVVALDRESEQRHKPDLKKGGLFISLEMTEELNKQAREKYGRITAANEILSGVVLSAMGCGDGDIARIEGDSLDPVRTGFSLANKWDVADRYPLSTRAGDHYRLDGNQALAIGALLGGCQFMAGYPMTPSTSIMVYFAAAALEWTVHFEQAEDEIAALNMALGASYAGLRSMVATSGGGFALMQEAVSLSGMTETPVVIIVGQRPGPSTGLPTRTEQADLNFVLHAGHGEFPRIVFAPGSPAEAVLLARKSFELADRFQIPVFILSDQYFADSQQIIEEPLDTGIIAREYNVYGSDYRRYAITENGVSPVTYPGLGDALVRVDSDEHDESGSITEDLNLRVRMVDKRLAKFRGIRDEAIAPTPMGEADADVFLVCWGSNGPIVKEAVERLGGEGIRVGGLHFGQVFPLTPGMIDRYGLQRRKVVAVENNATAQFAGLLKRELDITVSGRILKYDGTCFTVNELCNEMRTYFRKV
ncbi:MAG: 2-oxoacid:acceptor oxidoreductase subunit alpha [Syntrophales bacterium]